MKFGKLDFLSIQDGPGVRISLYVSGCRNHCPGCHNPQAQDFNFGKDFTDKTIELIMKRLSPDYVTGLTLVGGEPIEPENQRELVKLCRLVKTKFPNKDIWCYTGYEFEDLVIGGKKHIEVTSELLSYIDVLVTGRFILEQRDISDANRWRGSTNQRVIDVQKSLRTDNTIAYLDNIPNNERP